MGTPRLHQPLSAGTMAEVLERADSTGMERLVENGDGQLTIKNLQRPQKRGPTAILSAEDKENQKRVAEARKKYGRGMPVRVNQVKDKKLRANLKRIESKYKDAVLSAKDADILYENEEGFLQPESELEKTYKIQQSDIVGAVGVQQAKKSVDFKLDMGPYTADYARNGRSLLLAGRKGHVATCEWR